VGFFGSMQLEHNQCHGLLFFPRNLKIQMKEQKEQLEKLVLQMHNDGTEYSAAAKHFLVGGFAGK
jgi:hypothetical protein